MKRKIFLIGQYSEKNPDLYPEKKQFLLSPYYKALREGIDIAIDLSKGKYEIIDSPIDMDLDMIESEKNCGYILIAPFIDSQIVKVLESKNISAVAINYRSESLSWVDLNNVYAAELITEHLIKLGHKDILFIAGHPKTQNSIDRFLGFSNVLKRHNIKYNKEKLYLEGYFYISTANERVKQLLQHNNNKNFTAIFACNDLMAIGAVMALNENGIDITNITIAGFDDFDVHLRKTFSMLSYRQPLREVGYISTNLLIEQMETNKPDKSVHIQLLGEFIGF